MLSSIKKALKVLQIFSADQRELGVTEISNMLGSTKSSISKILITLASEGFLERNPRTRKYRLGMKLAQLGNQALNGYDLRELAGPFMEALAGTVGEIVHLSILEKNEIVYLEKKGIQQTLTIATRIGARSPAHASAMGKVLLSGLSRDELAGVLAIAPLRKLTPNTITEIPKLTAELDQIKKQGYAIDDEEGFSGIRCVAAPIRNRNGKIVAAISATVPAARMGPHRLNEFARHIMETARLISERVALSGAGE